MIRTAAVSLALLLTGAAVAHAQPGEDRRGQRSGEERADRGPRGGERPRGEVRNDSPAERHQRRQDIINSNARTAPAPPAQGGGDQRARGERRGPDTPAPAFVNNDAGRPGPDARGPDMRGRDGGDRRRVEGAPNGEGRRRDGDRVQSAGAPPQDGQGYAGRERGDAYGLRGGDDRRRDDERRGDGRGRDGDDDGNRWRDDGRNAYANDRGGDRWNDRGRDYRRDDGRSRDRHAYAGGGHRSRPGDGHGYRDRDHGRSWYSAGAYHQHYRAPYRYRAHAYRYPSGYFARSWAFGEYLPRGWYTPTYYLDWRAFDLPYPPIGCEWVRVGDDALLVDVWTGEILSVYYDIFW